MQKNLKPLVFSILISIICFQTAYAAQFVDVVEQSLFYKSITYFTTEMPILATDRDRFRPLEDVNKAEFFKLLITSGGYGPVNDMSDSPYHDVTGTEWYAPYVDKALDLNIIEFSEFNPNFNAADAVTRAQGLEWIYKFYGLDPVDFENLPIEYNDVSSIDPYVNISKLAFKLKLLHDYKSREFNGMQPFSRAEAIYVFYQIQISDLSAPVPTPNQISQSSTIKAGSDFDLFYQVWDKVNEEYIDKQDLDETELMYGAIEGLVNRIGDPYSVFFEPIDADQYQEALDGAFDGIGIYLTQKENDFVVLTPLKGSPAEEAGIEPNDIIVEIDNTPIRGLLMDDVIDLLRGETGTQVKLKINRNSNLYYKTITRSHIDIPSVESEMINNVGIIYYYQFTNTSNQLFTEEINKLTAQNPKGLVIDFRNNPGGYLFSAQQLISRFIPANEDYIKIMLTSGTTYSEKSSGPGDLKDMPLVIIINEGSASASEIAALALKDQLGAKIVGTTSFGKSKIQEIIKYNDGSYLKLSIARWLSPNGTLVEDIGITPDTIIELTDTDISNNIDSQLNKAISLIN